MTSSTNLREQIQQEWASEHSSTYDNASISCGNCRIVCLVMLLCRLAKWEMIFLPTACTTNLDAGPSTSATVQKNSYSPIWIALPSSRSSQLCWHQGGIEAYELSPHLARSKQRNRAECPASRMSKTLISPSSLSSCYFQPNEASRP